MILTELLAVVGIDIDEKALNDAEGAIGKLKTGILSLGTALAAGALVNGINSFVQGVATAAGEINALSARTDINTTDLQQLGVVAQSLGIELEDLAEAIEDVGDKIAEAHRDPASDLAKQLGRLGVEIRDANGEILTGADALNSYLDSVAALDNASERTLALSDISDTFRRFGPLVDNGTNEVRELLGELAGLEGLTGDVVEAGSELVAQQAVLSFAWTSIKNLLARELLPIFLDGVRVTISWAKSFLELAEGTNIVRNTLIALGAVAIAVAVSTIGVWGPAVLTFIAIAAAIGLVVLIIDDLITFLEGGDSVIGRFIDSLFGVGASKNVLNQITLAFQSIVRAAKIAWQVLQTGASLVALAFRVIDQVALDVSKRIDTFLEGSKGFTGFVDGLRTIGGAIVDFILSPFRTAIELLGLVGAGLDALGGITDEDVSGVTDTLSRLRQQAIDPVSGGAALDALSGDTTRNQPIVVANPNTASAASGRSLVVNQQTQVTLTASGADARQMREFQRIVDERLAVRNAQAAEALGEAAAD